MMDKLENFMTENRDQFEVARDPSKGWNTLENRLHHQKPKYGMTLWRVAAMLFMVTSFTLAYQLQNQERSNGDLASTTNYEQFYMHEISLKTDTYLKLAPTNQQTDFLQDLSEYQKSYQELSEEFEENGEVELLEALLENMRLQVLVLNEQIELLQQGATDETYTHDPNVREA